MNSNINNIINIFIFTIINSTSISIYYINNCVTTFDNKVTKYYFKTYLYIIYIY